MIESLEYIGVAIVTISTLLAFLIIFKFNKLSNPLKVVGIYIIVGASIEIVSTAMYYKSQNNLKFLHLFTLFEFVIISHLFKVLYAILKSKFNVFYIAIPSTVFILLNTIFIENILNHNYYSSILSSIIVMIYSIHFFIMILDKEIQNYQFLTLKWFVYCLFFYHSISLIIMLFGNLSQEFAQESQAYIWGFRSLVILATKIIISYYFIKLFFYKIYLKSNE